MKFLLWCVLGVSVARTGCGEEALRGMVTADLEPVRAMRAAGDGDAERGAYPLSRRDARLLALTAAIGYFSGMIYGWEFEYAVGEKARNAADVFEWRPLGELPFGDARMTPGDTPGESAEEGAVYRLWADYEMDDAQMARRGAWTGGRARVLNARGSAGLDQDRQDALRAAAKQAVRSLARGIERERPRVVRGSMALATFPVITIANGEWAASAQFFIEIREAEKYQGY
jgi:hypothetical protein